MGNDRNVVAGREYYQWELEFPSIKSARVAAKRLEEIGADFLLEEDLIFVRDRDPIIPILEEMNFHHTWLTLDQQT